MKPMRLRIERPSRFDLIWVAWCALALGAGSLLASYMGNVVASNGLFVMGMLTFLCWIFLLMIKWSRP